MKIGVKNPLGLVFNVTSNQHAFLWSFFNWRIYLPCYSWIAKIVLLIFKKEE